MEHVGDSGVAKIYKEMLFQNGSVLDAPIKQVL